MTSPFSALIIGASRGIGLGIVRQLSMQGWQVVATCRGAVPADSPADTQWLKLDINHQDERIALKERLPPQQFESYLYQRRCLRASPSGRYPGE